MRINNNEPEILSVYRSGDLTCTHVTHHKEMTPMGYVNSLEGFDGYVNLEYPEAKKVKAFSHRGSGKYYYTDGTYNIFYHTMGKLNTE